ncbi:hypothetical protein [Methylomonas sp. YC3]
MSSTLRFTFLAAVFLVSGCVNHADLAEAPGESLVVQSVPDSNYLATQSYYHELISGTMPSIAELTLFTNQLPKGGDLHHHYSGALYAETYLDWVDKSHFCICLDNACQGGTKAGPEPVAKYEVVKHWKSGTCVGAGELRTKKKYSTVYRDLLKRWSDKDFANHFHEQSPPDQQFFDTFGFFGSVSDYSYQAGLQALKQRAIAENVLYLETMLKSAPAIDNPALAKTLNALNADSTDLEMEAAFQAYFDFLASDPAAKAAVEEYARSHEQAATGINDGSFILRFQTYVSRNSEPAKVFSGLYAAFAAAQQSALIVGVNLVGPENGYIAMRDYSLHMKMLRFLRQHFPETKLSLHAGELVLGMVPPEGLKSHIQEALNTAGARRIGHGIDIVHETDAYQLLEQMKTGDVAVEINLTSNAFILGVEYETHPLQLYRRYHVPYVISTDDAGVSRNNLSNEYLLFTSRYKPSYDELKAVVYNSIDYAFLHDQEKAEARWALDKRFAAFEAQIAKQLELEDQP